MDQEDLIGVVELRYGIIRLILSGPGELSFSQAKQLVETRREFCKGIERPMLIDITAFSGTINDKAAKHFRSRVATRNITLQAIVLRHPVEREQVRLALSLVPIAISASLFETRFEAERWLATHVQGPIDDSNGVRDAG